jgi:hypothetical protein
MRLDWLIHLRQILTLLHRPLETEQLMGMKESQFQYITCNHVHRLVICMHLPLPEELDLVHPIHETMLHQVLPGAHAGWQALLKTAHLKVAEDSESLVNEQ